MKFVCKKECNWKYILKNLKIFLKKYIWKYGNIITKPENILKNLEIISWKFEKKLEIRF